MSDIQELQKEIHTLNQWENLLVADNGKIGKFLKSELRGMISHVRRMYSDIRADQPNAPMQLLALQAEEKTVQKMLTMLENIQERKNELDKSLSLLSNMPVSEESVSEPFRSSE